MAANRIVGIAAASILLLAAAPALSQETAPVPAEQAQESQELQASILAIEPVQVPLDTPLVQRVLDGLPKVIALARELAEEQKTPESSDVEENPAYLFAPYIAEAKSAIRIEEMFKSIGFESYAQWANTVHSITLAADAASFGPSGDLDTQKAEAQEEIRQGTNLNEAEKKAALADLEDEFTALAEFEPLPGNVEAVQPLMERIQEARLGGVGEPGEEE